MHCTPEKSVEGKYYIYSANPALKHIHRLLSEQWPRVQTRGLCGLEEISVATTHTTISKCQGYSAHGALEPSTGSPGPNLNPYRASDSDESLFLSEVILSFTSTREHQSESDSSLKSLQIADPYVHLTNRTVQRRPGPGALGVKVFVPPRKLSSCLWLQELFGITTSV